MYLLDTDILSNLMKRSPFQNMERGQAVVAFGEPCKVQPGQFFEWTPERSSLRLSEETTRLIDSEIGLSGEPLTPKA